MNQEDIFTLISFTIPALITGSLAYYLFNLHIKSEEGRRRYLLHREAQKNALPLRLQSYERMTLFLERINASKLLIRIAPISSDKNDYATLIIQHIEQEFEHNLTQQIYMSDDVWNVILTAKNTLMQSIRKTSLLPTIENANQLREAILTESISKQSPTVMAIEILKKEVKELW